jgi:Helicase HerA, central domain
LVPDFDAMPPPIKGDKQTFEVGKVIHWKHLTQTVYKVSSKDLTHHAFVTGVTGSGKTNTIFYLLKQTAKSEVPFLVIEPAKTEYRALLDDSTLGGDLQVFTLGDERTFPLRLNPFEVVSWPTIPVGVHLDLLRSVFSASFGMWTPLPQVLEQCLYGVYKDRGWDITTNNNHRLDSKSNITDAFPTLSDLAAKVDEVIKKLGYEDKITDDMRAALLTRINGLRAGGKGRMLDVQRSIPMEVLLRHPTVLELEDMGDDDEKAFVMGLLLIRLYEYRRAHGEFHGLQHLLVIEEAHRLLTNVGPRRAQEEADPRGKAVETFANLLSEIRAYGQGVIVADQIPVKLAPEIIKNTNLKIAHRVVANDDRMVLAGAMAMDERQARALATLTLNEADKYSEAAVYSEGNDAPVLVGVPPAKDLGGQTPPNDQFVRERMFASKLFDTYKTLFQPLFLPFPAFDEIKSIANTTTMDMARQIVEEPAFQRTFARMILSTIEDAEALDRLWPDVLSVIRANSPPKITERELLPSLLVYASEWYAQRRGAQIDWTYAETQELADKLRRMLLAKVADEDIDSQRRNFREYVRQLLTQDLMPCSACDLIFSEKAPMCVYRHAVEDLVSAGYMKAAWFAADAEDAKSKEGGRKMTWEVCLDAAYELIEFPEDDWPIPQRQHVRDAARRVSLCYAQQMLIRDIRKQPRTARRIMNKLLTEAKK